MEAYCLKCRTKREMNAPQPYTMKNGKNATTGICPVCDTKMFKIGKATSATDV
jgi:Zn finger protein HypA/HybF involved in hydrogenase expression